MARKNSRPRGPETACGSVQSASPLWRSIRSLPRSHRSGRTGVTIFHLRETDSQVGGLIPIPGGFISIQQNIGGIKSSGIEFEGTWLASDNFLLGGTFAFFDSRTVDTLIIRALDAGGNPIFDDISGDRPNRAPKETATVYGEYTVLLGGGSSLLFRADWRHRSDSFSNTANRDTGAFTQPEINDWGARFSWLSASGGTRVSLWAKNIREDWDIVTTGPPPGTFQQQYPPMACSRTPKCRLRPP